jgi:hypothetical protein
MSNPAPSNAKHDHTRAPAEAAYKNREQNPSIQTRTHEIMDLSVESSKTSVVRGTESLVHDVRRRFAK